MVSGAVLCVYLHGKAFLLAHTADCDYEHVCPPQWKVLVMDEGEGEGDGETDREDADWELLDDGDSDRSHGGSSGQCSPLSRTFAEVAAGV